MKNRAILLLFIGQIILSAFSPFFEFFSDIYISPGETTTIEDLRVDEHDYYSQLSIYMDDGSNFYGHTVEAKVRMRTQGGESCDFYAELYAFDDEYRDDDVSDIVYLTADVGWSNWAGIGIDMNAEYVKLLFDFGNGMGCDLSSAAYVDVSIRIDGGEPEPPPSYCGDGVIDPGEECDGGSNCNSDCTIKEPDPPPSYCGDGVIDPGEECDGGPNCTSNCRLVPEEVNVNFWADTYNIISGECTYLHWQADNARTVYIDGDETYPYAKLEVCPGSTTTYQLDVEGENGEWITETVTIYVEQVEVPEPEIDFWADDYQIEFDSCTYLNWDVINAELVVFEGQERSHNDYQEVCPEYTTDYVIEILDENGDWHTGEIRIIVTDPTPEPVTPLEVNFWADEYVINKGECTRLYWEVTGADSIMLDSASVVYSGEKDICPNSTEEYSLWGSDKGGESYEDSLTIQVTDTVECEGDDGFALIVTDSKLLNIITGNSSTWESVKSALEDYYGSSAEDCLGKPIFLDLAEVQGENTTSYSWVDGQIEDFIRERKVESPAAVIIIGGPQVIPHPIVDNNFGWPDKFSDDVYADFDHDSLNLPDTVITRLPDGTNKQVMLNYIQALSENQTPPDSAVFIARMTESAHRLNHARSIIEISRGQTAQDLYLEDFIGLQASEVHYLLAPLWTSFKYDAKNIDYKLIQPSDSDNYRGTGENSTLNIKNNLNHKHIIFGGFNTPKGNTNYFMRNFQGGLEWIAYAPDFDNIGQGAHIFSLADHAADLYTEPKFAEHSIPIKALNAGAHHFIGSLGLNTLTSNSVFNQDKQYYGDISLNDYGGYFVRSFFKMTSSDPSVSFWQAKRKNANDFAGNPAWPNIYIYYGLPERMYKSFGKHMAVGLFDDPEPKKNSFSPTADCPSGKVDDCDGDELDDGIEFRIASHYSPYLILDEGESQWPLSHPMGRDPFGVYWQVSPGAMDGNEGVWITYVFTYTEDGGSHNIELSNRDCQKCLRMECGWKFWNCISVPACLTAEALFDWSTDFGVNYNYKNLLFGHSGDNEGFRIFVKERNDGTYSLTHINWSRHHEGFDYPGQLQTLAQAQNSGLNLYNGQHPMLYVSEDKHATYPSHEICEGYKMEIPGWSDCFIGFEHCSGHPIWNESNPFKPIILKEHNVGEAEQVMRMATGSPVMTRFHLFEDMSPIFPDENVWSYEQPFCGGVAPSGGLADEKCGGPFGNRWFQ